VEELKITFKVEEVFLRVKVAFKVKEEVFSNIKLIKRD
jgi:hypothetical protein